MEDMMDNDIQKLPFILFDANWAGKFSLSLFKSYIAICMYQNKSKNVPRWAQFQC